MKLQHRQRIYIYLTGLFIVFATITIYFILDSEKQLKEEIVKSDQVVYARIVNKYIESNHLYPDSISQVEQILSSFPEDFRLSILDKNGNIVYHSLISNTNELKNQKNNSEIKRALLEGEGWSKKGSSVMGDESMFYAYYNTSKNYIVRVGVPYNADIQIFFSPNKHYVFSLIAFFIIAFFLFTLLYVNHHNTIKKLVLFVLSFQNKSSEKVKIPDDLHQIAQTISDVYNQLELNEKEIVLEREKLLQHFQYSEEGISFFTKEYANIYTNAHFIQFLNIMLDEPTFDVNSIFNNSMFKELNHFLEHPYDSDFSCKVNKGVHYFFIRVVIFEDESFEIIIRDISKEEREYYDKTETTNNIAHELKTPITSIRGYLETLIENPHIQPDKQRNFIERAYKQTIRFTEIIQDVILLSKTAHGRDKFELEDINILELLEQQVKIDCLETIEKRNSTIVLNIQPNVVVKGNRTLLYSLFFNLGMNALKYAGEDVIITINNYMEDEKYYYFSFADNGTGIEEKHLKFIFDRFYRITEGRTRDSGGSGLGLSIVKDAVAFHYGTILAKNRSEGGLEFLFTLRKE